MVNEIINMFSYDFIVRAFIVGILISLCAALIGTTLVLKGSSMIGDGLSHVAFGCISIATILGFAPLEFSLPIVVFVSFLILRINENSSMHKDSLIALVSASSLAIGIFLISVVKGVNIDINNYLFGSILSVSFEDVIISIILSIIVIGLYVISYNKIFALTFDEKFAKSIGINVDFYNILFSSLCSIVVVLGMRLTGSLLISCLIIFPSISAIQLFKSFKGVVIISSIISIFAFIIGLFISCFYSTPTGATIVIINLIVFVVFKLFSLIKKSI